MQSQYPEHDKLNKVREQSQWLGEFLEWGQSKGYVLMEEVGGNKFIDGTIVPVRKTIIQLLSEYLDVDLNKLEQEKEAMLQSIRELSDIKDKIGSGVAQTDTWVEQAKEIRELQENKYSWIQPGVVVWYTNGMLMATNGIVNSIMQDGRINIDVTSGTVILPKEKCYKTEQEADKR